MIRSSAHASEIVCSKLTKRYRGAVAVDGVSLAVTGGICALLGPNGAGKSTLLKLLSGLAVPDAGTVTIAGLESPQHPMEIRQALGVLPEEIGVFDDLTIFEHFEMTGPVYGLSARDTARRGGDLLKLLRLDRSANTLGRNCSFGMRKKVGIALALLHNPQVVLLDEPFEGIDPASCSALEQTLRVLSARGTTVLFTSHILPLVERTATRIILLKGGRVILDEALDRTAGSLEERYARLIGFSPFEEISWLGGPAPRNE